MSQNRTSDRKKRRRSAPLLWGSGTVAAAILILGVNGTLSAWSSAVIDNSNNSAASAAAVALTETVTSQTNPGTPANGTTQVPGTVCDTRTDTTGTNSVTCSTINKYGGIGNGSTGTDQYGWPLAPGDSQTVVVTMKNVGNASAPLKLTPGTCTNQAYPGAIGVDTTTYNLCNEMQLSVSCAAPSTYNGASAYSGTVGGFTGDQAIGTLAAGDSTDCTFTVTLPATASAGYASQYLTQGLVWTLGS